MKIYFRLKRRKIKNIFCIKSILFFLCLLVLICTILFFRSGNGFLKKNNGFVSFSLIVQINDENEWQTLFHSLNL